jgi:hypothetical protein
LSNNAAERALRGIERVVEARLVTRARNRIAASAVSNALIGSMVGKRSFPAMGQSRRICASVEYRVVF